LDEIKAPAIKEKFIAAWTDHYHREDKLCRIRHADRCAGRVVFRKANAPRPTWIPNPLV